MTTKKKTTLIKRRSNNAPPLPDIYFRLNSLLHTMRSITQREDQVCVLLHELKRSARLDSEVTSELAALLEELPSDEYIHDLSAVHAALDLISSMGNEAVPSKKVKRVADGAKHPKS